MEVASGRDLGVIGSLLTNEVRDAPTHPSGKEIEPMSQLRERETSERARKSGWLPALDKVAEEWPPTLSAMECWPFCFSFFFFLFAGTLGDWLKKYSCFFYGFLTFL